MKLKHQKYFQATRNYNNKTVDIHPAAGRAMVRLWRTIPRSGLPKKKLSLGFPAVVNCNSIFSLRSQNCGECKENKTLRNRISSGNLRWFLLMSPAVIFCVDWFCLITPSNWILWRFHVLSCHLIQTLIDTPWLIRKDSDKFWGICSIRKLQYAGLSHPR